MKNKKGITLIALVITIIVLLILSAVAISLLIGYNGILSKSTSAKLETAKSAATEKLNLKLQNLIINKNGVATLIDLNEFVDSTSSNYDSEITVVNEVVSTDKKATLKMDGYVFIVNEALRISTINGDTNELPTNSSSVAQGIEVKLPDVWETTATRNISTSTRIRSIINKNFKCICSSSRRWSISTSTIWILLCRRKF